MGARQTRFRQERQMTFLIILLLFFTATDILYMRIPNIVILPALVIAGFMTGNWLWMAVMALTGALLVNRNYWCGGDAKLLAFIGAFLTWQTPIVLIGTIALTKAYRRVSSRQGRLPVAPFMAISTLVIMGLVTIRQWCLKVIP